MSRSARTELLGGVEGQLEEMYRDLAVQVKRMGQLQAQADELRTAFRQLEGHGEESRKTIVRDDSSLGRRARD